MCPAPSENITNIDAGTNRFRRFCSIVFATSWRSSFPFSFVTPITEKQTYAAQNSGKPSFLSFVLGGVALIVAELASLIALEANRSDNPPATIIINSGATTGSAAVADNTKVDNVPNDVVAFTTGSNVCEGKKPDLPNVKCIVDAMTNVGPQAGANVTNGYVGGIEVDHVPITTPYWMNGMCPVNVHWHLGAEHLSVGEYDEQGDGPNGGQFGPDAVSGDGEQPGYRCRYYDATDTKFTRKYNWKHCIGMEVGETYEVQYVHTCHCLYLFSALDQQSNISLLPPSTVGPTRLPVHVVLPTSTKPLSMMVSSARMVFSPTLPPRLVFKPRSLPLSMMRLTTGLT